MEGFDTYREDFGWKLGAAARNAIAKANAAKAKRDAKAKAKRDAEAKAKAKRDAEAKEAKDQKDKKDAEARERALQVAEDGRISKLAQDAIKKANAKKKKQEAEEAKK